MKDKIKNIIEKEFNAEVVSIKRITEGFSHYMYEVKITKKPFILIVRFSNNTKEDVNLEKEKYIIEILRKNNIPAPKIYAFNPDYMILEKLSGIRLDTIWDSMPKSEQIQITKEMGKLIKKIHLIKLKKFGRIHANGYIKSDEAFKFRQVGEIPSFNVFSREWLIDHLKDFARLLSYKHINKNFMKQMFLFYLDNLEHIEYKGKPTLIHGDFHQGHIFIEKNKDNWKITGLIDFEFAQSYSPEYDFIKLHRNNFFDIPELKHALIQGYGLINEKAVEIHRTARDFGFGWAMAECGNAKIANETFKKIEKRIKNTSQLAMEIEKFR